MLLLVLIVIIIGVVIIYLGIYYEFKDLQWVFNSPPKPHAFVSLPLKSDDLTPLILEINRLLPQLAEFITQFNLLVTENSVNVITDALGNMSIEVPKNMSDNTANSVSGRLSIIDRLINSHGSSLNEQFQKGLNIENKIRSSNPEYKSQILEQIAKFKELNNSYKH